MENKVIHARETKQWRGKISYRDVPMRPEVHQALSSYFASRPPFEPDAHIFPFLHEEGIEEGKKGLVRTSQRLSQCSDDAEVISCVTCVRGHGL